MCVFPCQIQWLTQSTERRKKKEQSATKKCYTMQVDVLNINVNWFLWICPQHVLYVAPTNSLKITEEKSIYLQNMNDESSTMSNLFDEGRSVMTVEKKTGKHIDCALMLRRSLTCNLEIAFSSNKQRMYHHDKWENYISEFNQTESNKLIQIPIYRHSQPSHSSSMCILYDFRSLSLVSSAINSFGNSIHKHIQYA